MILDVGLAPSSSAAADLIQLTLSMSGEAKVATAVCYQKVTSPVAGERCLALPRECAFPFSHQIYCYCDWHLVLTFLFARLPL